MAGDPDPAERVAELSLAVTQLREENERLREEYARAKRASHRRAAVGLATIGLLAVGAGVLFPDERQVLFAIGAIGLFAGILTAYLTPEHFVAATVGEAIFGQQADTLEDLIDELGLTEHRVYVPTETSVRLFVPQVESYRLPDPEALEMVLVLPEDEATKGVSVKPSGARLSEELLGTDLSETESPIRALDVLAEGLVETFELADAISPEVESPDGQARVTVTNSHFGSIENVDHPIPSVLACGLARTLEEPVTASVAAVRDDGTAVLSLRWSTDGD